MTDLDTGPLHAFTDALAPNGATDIGVRVGSCDCCAEVKHLDGVLGGDRYCLGCAIEMSGELIAEALDSVRAVSVNDDLFTCHCAYGLLALLWGRVPGRDNLDYQFPGYPGARRDLAEPANFNVDLLTDRIGPPAYVVRQAWVRVTGYAYMDGPQHLLNVITHLAATEDFAKYALAAWDEMVTAHGPNPFNLER